MTPSNPATTARPTRSALEAAVYWAVPSCEDVAIAVHGGTVELTGSVHAVDDRDRVVAAAFSSPGVRVLVDDVEVRSLGRAAASDRSIADALLELLARMPSVPTDGLRLRVRQGVVTVLGTMPWRFQRDTVLNLVAAVPGVRDVVDAVVLMRPASEAVDADQHAPTDGWVD